MEPTGARDRILADDAAETAPRALEINPLVDELLDGARFAGMRLETRAEIVDLRRVVALAVERSRALVSAHGQRVHVAMPEEAVVVRGVLTSLVEVLTQLCTNAVHFTEVGGQVWIDTARCDGMAEVRVRDTGVGISAAMLSRIFDLFAKADAAGSRWLGGLGVGLTVARRVVEQHGGTLDAQSEGVGMGSEFVVRLPLLGEPNFAYAKSASRAARSGSVAKATPAARRADTESGRRVLIVDDYPSVARSMSQLLTLVGHDVAVAYDGESAVQRAREFRPEVVFLDIGLPLGDGFSVAEQLRTLPGLEHVVLVALTGSGDDRDRSRARACGFDHFLLKPVDLDALQRVIQARD
jgi:CheY-like chemotaxis protein